MGSPNFYTGQEIGLNVGMDFDSAAERLFGESARGMEFDEYETELVMNLISDTYQRVEEAIDDMDARFLNHSFEIKQGYHSGFQIYVNSLDDPESFVDHLNHNDDEIFIVDTQGYDLYAEDIPAIATFGTVTLVEDEDGHEAWVLEKNTTALSDFLSDEVLRANHELAKIALECGLNEVVGLSWTSSLAPEDVNKEYLMAYLDDESFAPDALIQNQSQTFASPSPAG